jgi:hypothetical protein
MGRAAVIGTSVARSNTSSCCSSSGLGEPTGRATPSRMRLDHLRSVLRACGPRLGLSMLG